MQGTGFAVHTGWTQPGTGLLVIENANGQVENINQMVGVENNSRFAALAQYDTNHDVGPVVTTRTSPNCRYAALSKVMLPTFDRL
jgi:hypothetical protein